MTEKEWLGARPHSGNGSSGLTHEAQIRGQAQRTDKWDEDGGFSVQAEISALPSEKPDGQVDHSRSCLRWGLFVGSRCPSHVGWNLE
jgi:hypothetical protein